MERDTAFQMSASNLRFGPGTMREVGMDLLDLAARRVMVVIDPALVELPTGQMVRESLHAAGVDYELFDGVSIEPTDASFRAAAAAATEGGFDALLAVRGGSAIAQRRVGDSGAGERR